jgi:hypothetical protein
MVLMIDLWKVSNFCLFPPITIKKKRTRTSQVAGFLLGFESETIVILQIIHLSFILLCSKCPFPKGSFCVKSICKNNFYIYSIPICMLSTLLVKSRYISVVQHMAWVFFSAQLQILIVFLIIHYLNLNLEEIYKQKIEKYDLAKE